jgi:hypothetical protein
MLNQWSADPRAMDKPSSELPPGPNEGRLDSWKKIAVYLKRDVTTVQRWEKREGMPVHRHLHGKMGSVYAFQSELDAWMHARSDRTAQTAIEPGSEDAAISGPSRATLGFRWPAIAVAGALGTLAIVLIVWFERSDHFWQNPFAGAAYQSVTGFDGRPDIGTKFAVKAATPESTAHPLPELVLTRGARHLALLPGGRKLVFLQGEIQHKNLWMVDLESGAMQQLTHMPAEFDVRDFDLSSDGTEAILERAQSRSDVVVIDRPAA